MDVMKKIAPLVFVLFFVSAQAPSGRVVPNDPYFKFQASFLDPGGTITIERTSVKPSPVTFDAAAGIDSNVTRAWTISTGRREHKFGVPIPEARSLYAEAAKCRSLSVAGVSVHIGSQITDVGSFQDALERVAELVHGLRQAGHDIRYVDAGGGLGISYQGAQDPFPEQVAAYAKAVLEPLRELDVHLLLEPGRAIVGPAGVLLTRVIYRKTNNGKRFLIVDAAMNDLLRPSLYSAYHEIVPVKPTSDETELTDVVGPICESGDFFARHRELPVVGEGELLAILDAGAYGSVLGSNYNTRGRAAEVLVNGAKTRVIRRRESVNDQLKVETP